MIDDEFCSIDTQIGEGSVASITAMSMGFIVPELVINALKHAFPENRPGSLIVVTYEANRRFCVSNNGGNASANTWPPAKIGLGTTIVNALAQQLDARVDTAKQIAAITSHRTLAEMERYTRAADQEALARQALKKKTGTDGGKPNLKVCQSEDEGC